MHQSVVPKQLIAISKNEQRVNPAAKRYRPGKVPEFAREESEFVGGVFATANVAKMEPIADRRLSRLQQQRHDGEDHSERLQRHKRIIQEAEILGVEADEDGGGFGELEAREEDAWREEEQAAIAARTERLARVQRRRQEEQEVKQEGASEGEASEEALPLAAEEEEMDEDEAGDEGNSSSGDMDSDDDAGTWASMGGPSRPLILPKFVAKDKRVTVVDLQSKAEEEEEKLRLEKEKQMIARKQRTLEDLKAAEANAGSEAAVVMEEDVNTSEEGPAEKQAEFDEWRLRELQRVRRDREEREKMKLEQMEVEARRGLTDEEVILEKRKMGIGVKEQKKLNFMQKYYHKGAYYSDEMEKLEKDTSKEHDWAAPVGEDKFVDKSMLPKVMQVKNFGRSGRTKYTHLKDQDTSNLDDVYNFQKKVVPDRVQKQMGGMQTSFKKPTTQSRTTSSNNNSNG